MRFIINDINYLNLNNGNVFYIFLLLLKQQKFIDGKKSIINYYNYDNALIEQYIKKIYNPNKDALINNIDKKYEIIFFRHNN